MSFAVSRDDVAAAFGADRLVRIPAESLNAAVSHADSRRFLIEVGLPAVGGFLYVPMHCLTSGLPSAASFEPEFDELEGLPETVGDWVALGYCYEHTIFLDGATGMVWVLYEGELLPVVCNSRVDLFARCLLSVFSRWDVLAGDTDYTVRTAVTNELATELAALDPSVVAAPDSFWRGSVLFGLTGP